MHNKMNKEKIEKSIIIVGKVITKENKWENIFTCNPHFCTCNNNISNVGS